MSKIRRFFAWFFNRKLQVDIITLFISLFLSSYIFIISFTYIKNSKSILKIANSTIQLSGEIIQEKINCFIEHADELPVFSSPLFRKPDSFSAENSELIAYMFQVLIAHPDLYALYAGSREGNLISATRKVINQKGYWSDPSKPLPSGYVYTLEIFDFSKSTEEWFYKDESLKTIGRETVTSTFDHRLRPWYEGAVKERSMFWTDTYTYVPENIPGITVSYPIFNQAGDVVGVVGADLTLMSLLEFITRLKIGENGKAFILTNHGGVVDTLREQLGINIERTYKDALTIAYNHFLKYHQENFVFSVDKTKYLTYIKPFSGSFEKTWLIAVIVPLEDFFEEILETQYIVLVVSIIILIFSGLIIVYFSRRISSPIVKLAREVNRIKKLDFTSEFRVKSNIYEINLMDSSIAAMRVALRSFGRYVPKEIVKQMIEKGQESVLGGEKKEITIFFSDIEGFTSIAETLPTETMMVLLAEYFDALSKIIVGCHGTIDKYIGDSIMAIWGAPTDVPDHAAQACTAALLCKVYFTALNEKHKENNKPEFRTRIGINTGTCIVGNIGTSERMNYTVIGDSVNTASRLQTMDKFYHTVILISEEVKNRIGNQFITRPLDIVTVKGKKQKTKIYELIGKLEDDLTILPKSEDIELCVAFTEAYEVYQRGEIEKARVLFQKISQKFPTDFPTKMYLERIEGTTKDG